MENRYIDPRYRSSGKLGSDQWMTEREEGTGGFPENPSLSRKTVVLSVLAIMAAVFAVIAIGGSF